MYPETTKKIKEKMKLKAFPGAVYSFIEGEESSTSTIGLAQIEPVCRPMKENAVFDVASLTKVICTTTMMLKLWEQGEFEWDQTLQSLLPSFQDPHITLRHLLTHTSDIQTYIPNRDQLNAQELRVSYLTLRSGENLGKQVKYTDAGTILLGFLLEHLYQENVVDIFQKEILKPLAMENSYFLPEVIDDRFVPTEKIAADKILQGVTHDPKARVLAEHAGNAGLFTNMEDLKKFTQMYLNFGSVNGKIYLHESTITFLLSDRTPSGKKERSIGWDLKASPLDQQPLLFHTGYTGTFMLIDSLKQSAFLFLSNRVHPQDYRSEYLRHRDDILATYLAERAGLYQK
ncbi:serine hydrolase domain-containing protein [Candidatus Enterococcus ferrettii]|uniref:Beta-lactamase-related domain-containing protein n=1 Tax=Candidatus Enterococcus ferrettii TaxID=2815324 RepID=A0ABV0ERG7_9ENTE|nr:serine hydrolase domain-containing protein [Enterococcus sp. 665A]MBO1342037.1 beta-lactamase family protein [Enterococcus sp. 665A]